MMDEVVSRRNPVPGVSAPHDEGHYAEWADKRPAENPCWCWGQRHRNFFSELTWTDKLLNNNLWDFISQLQVLFSFSSLLIKSPTAQRAGLSLRGPEWPQHTGVANLVLMAFLITFIFAVSVMSPLCCFIGQVLDHTHTHNNNNRKSTSQQQCSRFAQHVMNQTEKWNHRSSQPPVCLQQTGHCDGQVWFLPGFCDVTWNTEAVCSTHRATPSSKKTLFILKERRVKEKSPFGWFNQLGQIFWTIHDGPCYQNLHHDVLMANMFSLSSPFCQLWNLPEPSAL